MNSATGPDLSTYDVVIVGGGHNGLTAAAYLARAGVSTLVLERLAVTGGAAVSSQAFKGYDARLSRYSYLVSLMPEQIATDLNLDLELRSRATASFTPYSRDGQAHGLLAEHNEGTATRESFKRLTGSDEEYDAWQAFYSGVQTFAEVLSPTLLDPLRTESEIASMVDPAMWRELVKEPLGSAIENRFTDDLVRGVVGTDALIGTFADLGDPSLIQNRCFLYHLIGNGTGEWRVPVAGMGAVTDALRNAALAAGAEIITGAGVSDIFSDGTHAEVTWHDGSTYRSVAAGHVLSNVAPWVLRILLGEEGDDEDASKPSGSQLKINLLLDRLPRLKSGVDPEVAFGGTLHLAEGYGQLRRAYAEAAAGQVPSEMPGEIYCHSLSDRSILGSFGGHTLTYFGLHTPAALFDTPATRNSLSSAPWPHCNSISTSPSRTVWPPTEMATHVSRPNHPRTLRRIWRCPVGTSSTETWSGRGRRTGPDSTPLPSSGVWRPTSTTCCCVVQVHAVAAQSRVWADTTRPRLCWHLAERPLPQTTRLRSSQDL